MSETHEPDEQQAKRQLDELEAMFARWRERQEARGIYRDHEGRLIRPPELRLVEGARDAS